MFFLFCFFYFMMWKKKQMAKIKLLKWMMIWINYLPGSGVNDKGSSTDPLVLVVACLGAFVLVFLILIIVCICKRNNGKPSPSANQSVETPEIHEKMLGDHQTVQQSTGSPGSGGSGRHHQQHPNSHYTVRPTSFFLFLEPFFMADHCTILFSLSF